MKKFGILTFHFSDNYGAALQCYALRHYIKQYCGCEADIINFNPGRKYGWYDDDELQRRYLEKINKYKTFHETYNELSGEEINSTDLIDQSQYDGFIVGSDQVWNTSFTFFDKAYLLDFVQEGKRKISYAASVGLALNDSRLRKDLFEKYLPDFYAVSVREKTHEAFVDSYSACEATTVVDPTLLLTRDDYDDLAEDVDLTIDQDYIFFYYLKHDTAIPNALSFVNKVAKKCGLKVIHYCVEMPPQALAAPNESFYFDGPKEFVWYIKHAKLVVTNSFHATVFSLLYHKPFYTYLVKSMSSRISDLLGDLGLMDRIITGYKPIDQVDFDIDFEQVDAVLDAKRNASAQFLKNALWGD